MLISHANKVMLKNLQAGLQQCVNQDLPDVEAGFIKGRGTRDPWIGLDPTFTGSQRWQGNSRKPLTSAFDYAKPFDCVDHNKM